MTFEEKQAIQRAAEAKHGQGAGVNALLTSAEGRAWLKIWANNTPLLMMGERVREWVEQAKRGCDGAVKASRETRLTLP